MDRFMEYNHGLLFPSVVFLFIIGDYTRLYEIESKMKKK
jgi:hypothetical protein